MPHPVRAIKREDLHFYVYIDVEGRYNWRLIGKGDYDVARSSQGYVNRSDCLYALNLVARFGGSTAVPIEYAAGLPEVDPTV